MGYRHDQFYKFVVRTYEGNITDVWKLVEHLPFDCTTKIELAQHSREHPDNDGLKSWDRNWKNNVMCGAIATISFVDYFNNREDGPYNSKLLNAIHALKETRFPASCDFALFRQAADDEPGMIFGVETWDTEFQLSHRLGGDEN